MLPFHTCPCWGQSIWWRLVVPLSQTGLLNIIVRHMKSILVLSLPIRVYGPMRSTNNALQGVVMTSFGGTWPCLWLCLLFIRQNLQDLAYDWMVLHIPFKYIVDLIVSLRHEWPGCWRYWWYQLSALCHRDAGMINLSSLHSTCVSSISWQMHNLSGVFAFCL